MSTPLYYHSTRGGDHHTHFTTAVMQGLAADGGLFVPTHYPHVDATELAALPRDDYQAVALAVCSRLGPDIPAEQWQTLLATAYTAEQFAYVRPGQAAHAIAPILTLNDTLHLLQVSNGPTLAFKDMAMQLLGGLFEYVLTQQNSRMHIIGATSGDTGSAAQYAMIGRQRISVCMLSPEQRMSPFQRAQMYSLDQPNICNIAVDGTFDECQDIVKALLNDPTLKQRWPLGAVNSINWARIAAQVVYYFYACHNLAASPTQPLEFVVPTGNFGNILAAHIAHQMGAPIHRLVMATNENDVLAACWREGIYRPRTATNTYVTSSPSMDIAKASNFERFVYDLLGRNPETFTATWQQLTERGALDLRDQFNHWPASIVPIVAASSQHGQRLTAIHDVYARYQIIIDPHTADAYSVHQQIGAPDKGVRRVIVETAQACKFNATIVEALGHEAPYPGDLKQLLQHRQHYSHAANSVAAVQQVFEQFMANHKQTTNH